MNRRYFAYPLLLVGLLLAACQPRPDELTHLTLLHSNDTHSRMEPLKIAEQPDQGGVARRMTLIEQARAEQGADRVLLVDAGDFSQGTLFYNVWGGAESIMAMNHLGYDAFTFGNHEFDRGLDKLVALLRGEPVTINGQTYPAERPRARAVSSNITFPPEFAGLVEASAIIEKGGQRYGILGVTTDTTPEISKPGPARFGEYLAAVQTETDRLMAQGVNKIILLSHDGYNVDVTQAPFLSGVDIIVSGHDHALLGNPAELEKYGLSGQRERLQGPYPTVLEDRDGHPVLVVSAMEWGRWLGRLEVDFDAGGVIQSWQGRPVPVLGCMKDDCRQAVAEDPALRDKVAQYRQPLSAFADAQIGEAGMAFAHDGVRSGETPLGNLLADVMLAAARDRYGAVAALANAGGLRRGINQGPVSFGTALEVLPFGDTLSVLELSGAELRKVLEHSITRGDGAFLQVAGLRVTYSADQQVKQVEIAGQPLDPDKIYRVAINSYIAGGGDAYTMLPEICQRGGRLCEDSGLLTLDLLVEEFKRHSPVTRQKDGRITLDNGR